MSYIFDSALGAWRAFADWFLLTLILAKLLVRVLSFALLLSHTLYRIKARFSTHENAL